MSPTAPQSNPIDYREPEFRYDSEMLLELEGELVRGLSKGKQYRQKRSTTQKRRKAPKVAHPGCGMAARRHRRWTW